MTEIVKDGELPRAWFHGTRAIDNGPELTEATLEAACTKIEQHRVGYGFAFFCFTRLLGWRILQRVREHGSALAPSLMELRAEFAELQRPRMRKEFVPLFEGEKLIGQMTIERPFDARDNLPYVQRVHPDDIQNGPYEEGSVPAMEQRIQRFYLHNGRYRLEGSF